MSDARVFWFLIGSQHLYGEDVIRQVEQDGQVIVDHLRHGAMLPYEIMCKPVLTTSEGIRRTLLAASANDEVIGVIIWMHTFSPAKMWIAGLTGFHKPLLHLHTQFHRDIPWDTIDMDFMNLHQSAHGDREFGALCARLGVRRQVIAGHWADESVLSRIAAWMRSAIGVAESTQVRVARFGDNMRQVAVTEGDKVEAAMRLGWTVDGFGVGDLVASVQSVASVEVDALVNDYAEQYEIASTLRHDEAAWGAVRGQARIELGMTRFLEAYGYQALTTTFEDLHGLDQLPGLAVQRLMAKGYGFGGEGDWKTAALLRVMKAMANFEATSFMEDYTYHWEPGRAMILGAHMLEVCPTIAATRPRVEVHPLGIGGKADPARLVFDGASGPAICASLVDIGHRFRLIVNVVDAVQPPIDMPRLPVARVLWSPQPSLATSAEAWIYAGGAHHTVMSYRVTAGQMRDWADMQGIECVVIDRDTQVDRFRQELRWNEAVFGKKG